jgi:hypothetical protein
MKHGIVSLAIAFSLLLVTSAFAKTGTKPWGQVKKKVSYSRRILERHTTEVGLEDTPSCRNAASGIHLSLHETSRSISYAPAVINMKCLAPASRRKGIETCSRKNEKRASLNGAC